MAKKLVFPAGRRNDRRTERRKAVNWPVHRQEKKFVAFSASLSVSSGKGIQPEQYGRPLPRIDEPHLKPEITRPFNYYALSENVIKEFMRLSEHPVCKNNPEIAREVEVSYTNASRHLRTISKMLETQKWAGDEAGLAGVASGGFYQVIYRLEKLYGIPRVPALREAYAALRGYSMALLGLEPTEEELNPDFDNPNLHLEKPKFGH